jgi:light-dependent protochlorophyllide reductase
MADKTVVITGGNHGLGFECARQIAADRSWHVLLACRDLEKGNTAVRKLVDESGNPTISCLQLDLGSLSSVRQFVENLKVQQLPPLQALVCNAGTQVVQGTRYTSDGFEETFGVNHLGHFLLTNLVLPQMTQSARIVIVSSGTHDPEKLEGRFGAPSYQGAEKLAYPQKADVQLSGMQRYTTSKLCNMLFAYELVRRLAANGLSNITVNAYDPGAVPGTGLTREYNPVVKALLRALRVFGLFGLRIYSPTTSGAAMARLVLDPALAGVSGKYFRGKDKDEAISSKESYSSDKAAELWETSVSLVKLSSEEEETVFGKRSMA